MRFSVPYGGMGAGERRKKEQKDEALLERIERTTEMPMLLLALAYLVVFIVGYLPGVSAEVSMVAQFAEYAIIAVFAAELVLKLAVAERKITFLRTHWLDVIIVLLPFLRPLRFLGFVRFLPMLIKSLSALRRIMGPYRGAYVLLVGILSVFICALLVTIFEQREGGEIQNFAEALWWAIVTMTTVGYGDMVPLTSPGRAIAVFLMVVGIALFGMLTAAVAAYFVGEEQSQSTTNEELMAKLEELEARLEEQGRSLKDLKQRGEER